MSDAFDIDISGSSDKLVSVLIVGLSYEARNVLSYTECKMQKLVAFRYSPIIPLRRSPLSDRPRTTWLRSGMGVSAGPGPAA